MRWVKKVDTVVATIHTWAWMVTILPTTLTWVFATIEGLPASRILLLVVAVLASSIVAVYYGILLYSLFRKNSENKTEQTRIANQLKEYTDAGNTEIDTVTAAAIWANTLEAGDLIRHLRFREIKSAIRMKEIKNTRQVDGSGGPNIHTHIPMNELREYFIRTGVIKD